MLLSLVIADDRLWQWNSMVYSRASDSDGEGSSSVAASGLHASRTSLESVILDYLITYRSRLALGAVASILFTAPMSRGIRSTL